MRYFDLTSRGIQTFYTSLPARWAVLQPVWNKQTRFYESKLNIHLFQNFIMTEQVTVFYSILDT